MALFGGPDIEKLKEKRDVSGLLKALQHKKTETRKEAAEALGEIGGTEAIPGLRLALQDSDPRVRVYGIQGLARIKDSQIAPALRTVVSDSDWEVRKEALSALIKTEGDVPSMLQAIVFNSAELRELAAVRLGDVITSDSVSALIEATKDQEEVVRLRATNSLKKISANPQTDENLKAEITRALNLERG